MTNTVERTCLQVARFVKQYDREIIACLDEAGENEIAAELRELLSQWNEETRVLLESLPSPAVTP